MENSAEKDQEQTSSSSPPPNHYLSEILHDVSTSIVFNNVAKGYWQEKSGKQTQRYWAYFECSPTKQTVPKICKIDRKLVVTSCN